MNVKHVAAVLVGLGSLYMTGCTSHQVSEKVTRDGVAQGIIFPKPDTSWTLGSIFPSDESIRQVGKGVTKHELYQLFGVPHFDEAHGAREWDYVFKYRDTPESAVRICQYKVIFDKDMLGQSFHWKPAGCHKKTPEVVVEAAPAVEKFSLDADALFAFDKWKFADMKPTGRRKITELANTLKDRQSAGQVNIQVVGHTDYLGDDMYNMNLSQLRAQTVRQLLVNQGVSSFGIYAQGMGEAQPVKQCSSALPRQSLIRCLQPNRRVEVIVQGVSK